MRAFFYFTITAIFWGLNFHFAKIMLREVDFVEAGFWRYLFGVIPLLVLAYKDFPSLLLIKKNLKGVFLIGVICLFGFNIFFFLGMTRSPAINGALIVSLTPAITLILSFLILGIKLKSRELIGVLISFGGVVYLIMKGNVTDLSSIEFSWGDILLLMAAFFFGLQNVWVKKYGGILTNLNFTFLTNFFCLLSFSFLLPFVGTVSVSQLSVPFWLSAFGIGVLGTSVAYFLWNRGIELTSPNHAGIFINVVPMSTALFSLFLGDEFYAYHIVSAIFIIVGVIIIMNRSTLLMSHE